MEGLLGFDQSVILHFRQIENRNPPRLENKMMLVIGLVIGIVIGAVATVAVIVLLTRLAN